jgi:hypothetical protein
MTISNVTLRRIVGQMENVKTIIGVPMETKRAAADPLKPTRGFTN